MLSFEAVTLRYNERFAIGPLDLDCASGTTTAIVGPSGCGKSTLLRLAAGILLADSGHVSIGGDRLHRGNVLVQRRRLGYVLQQGGLFPHLTARRNVTLMAHYLGWADDSIAQRLQELVELTHLPADLLDAYPANLSGGERQRVSLARALMLDPSLLLLDEPLGALDPIVRHDLQRELRDLFAALNKTVLIVTHDVAEAGYLAQNLVLMNAGRVVQTGTLAELVAAPAEEFVARFVGAQRQIAEVLEASS
ncbi:MAG TPA: ATP-binding cassette domain-containing protein [Steroidobacteraceae bacterium]|nr:ATP-binding cassette domain-containing protein [Steroidobacteraceae bacterium]